MSNDDLLDQIRQDADDNLPDDAQLSTVSRLAQRQIELEGEVDRLEKMLKSAKVRLDVIRDKELPEAMGEVGMAEFRLGDGRKITVKEEMYATVPASRRQEITSKLRELGAEDMISNTVTVPVGKGRDEEASRIMREAAKLGFVPKRDETVNTGSLKKFLRELLSQGEDVDLSFYGAYVQRRAKISQ